MITRRKLIATLTNCALLPKLAKGAGLFVPALFDVSAFGAIGDGAAINTKHIQAAIDACSTVGGGAVLVSGGNYVTGTLFLKSNVSLQIEAGSTLSGSPKIEDYPSGTGKNMYDHEPQLDRCLIFAKDAINIGIHGARTIDGHGASFPNQGDTASYRPMMLRFINCRNVFLNDVTLQNPAAWTSAGSVAIRMLERSKADMIGLLMLPRSRTAVQGFVPCRRLSFALS